MSWTHRERILAALAHEQPDRVPVDLGAGRWSTITLAGYERLKAHLGVDEPTEVMAAMSSVASPAETVLRRFGVDTRNVKPGAPSGGRARWVDENTYVDDFDVLWRRTDKAVDQHFLHQDGPFAGGRLTVDRVQEYDWPDGANRGIARGVRERIDAIKASGDYAISMHIEGGIIHRGYAMRGFEAYLKDFYRNPEGLECLLDRLCDYWCAAATVAIEAAGPGNLDMVWFGEDLGTQDGCMFDPERIYPRFIKPRHARMIETVKGLTGGRAKLCYHCCGSAYRYIPHLLEIGVEALNPVQVTARDMDPARLKAEFGDRLSFWGGINTQEVLPFGTPEEVAAETRRIIGILGAGGGYVLAAVHNIQAEVPPANVVAMYDAGLAHRYA